MPTIPPIDAAASGALGHRLRELREAAGMSQETVAQAAGISRNHLQVIEMGLSDRTSKKPWNPHLSVLIALCDALGVGVAAVIDVIDAPSDELTVEYDPGAH